MKIRKSKHKTWSITLSSGPQTPLKQLRLSKRLFYSFLSGSIIFASLLLFATITLTYILHDLQMEQEALFVKLEERESEIQQIQQEYTALSEEANAVRKSIEEFKAFEARLSEINLEMPEDLEDISEVLTDGSGGIEYPLFMGANVNNNDVYQELMHMRSELPLLIDSFEEAIFKLVEYEENLRRVPTIFPAEEGRISSHYGSRRDPITRWTRFHSGIDIAAPLNTPIYAAADGTVTFTGRDGGYGNTIVIHHGEEYETLYAHLHSIDVSVGDQVTKGDTIGGMGTTGRSTGVHLHYEIRKYGEPIDPYLYITFHQRDDIVTTLTNEGGEASNSGQ